MTSAPRPERPEISVLMSCYNGSRWLPQAMESVLSQTFTNFEFVVVDDGSKDNTLEIINSYAAKDARIVVIAKENSGLADSLNTGVAAARGGWVARVDQDDLCEPTRLERQLAFVGANPATVLLGSGFAEIDEHGSIIKTHRYPSGHDALAYRLEHLRGFFPHSSAFYHAETVRAIGGYNTRISRAEDWRLWLELSLKGKIACLPETLVRIRKHAGQMSLDSGGARQFCDATAATVCHLLRKNGHVDPSITSDKESWVRFLSWVDRRIAEDGALERLKVWGQARQEFFSSGTRPTGALRCLWVLLTSGRVLGLAYEKLFGSALPEKLAEEWVVVSGPEK